MRGLVILPRPSRPNRVYGLSLDYGVAGEVETTDRQLRSYAVPSPVLYHIRSYRAVGPHAFRLPRGRHRFQVLPVRRLLDEMVKAMEGVYIDEFDPRPPYEVYAVLRKTVPWARAFYIITRSRVYDVETAPSKLRVSRLYVSGPMAVMLP